MATSIDGAKLAALKERLLRKIKIVEGPLETPCWRFTGGLGGKGYGMIWSGGSRVYGTGRQLGAHVASYLVHVGPVPQGLCVCHHCDVMAYVNPDHLWLGTLEENNQDMMAKGRYSRRGAARGENICTARLTEKEVAEIKFLLEEGYLLGQEIATMFGVEESLISNIKRGVTWKHVEPAQSVPIPNVTSEPIVRRV